MEQRLSFITRLGIVFKKLTGVRDISALKKDIKKHIGKVIYHKKYNSSDIISIMKEMGMKKGSVVCIHASMKEFYNFQGSAKELIDKILETITDEGTLLMPAFPKSENITDPNFVFDLATTPTAAGYLAETFRQSPGVIRSINTQHSVCAKGKYAEWLTKDHHKCDNCWDKNSPWYRMTQLDALVFNLGMPKDFIGTFSHCVEALLWKENPYWKQFFQLRFTYKYRDLLGKYGEYTCHTCNIERRTREKKLTKYFKQHMHRKRISNLLISEYDSKECLDIMLKLGRKGITMYYVPSTKKYRF